MEPVSPTAVGGPSKVRKAKLSIEGGGGAEDKRRQEWAEGMGRGGWLTNSCKYC